MSYSDTSFLVSQGMQEMGYNLLRNIWLWKRPSPSHDARLDGQTIIVTGSNRTIGKEIAEDLCRRGARVLMACRNMDQAEAAANDIRSRVTSAVIVCHKLDLSSIESIEEFVDIIVREERKVDALINNAACLTMAGREETADGFEMMMGVNYLGTVLLSLLLLPKLQKTSSDPRILFVASLAHAGVKAIHWDDLQSQARGPIVSAVTMDVYGHTKLLLLLFVREFAKRAYKLGVRVYAVDPGVSTTDIVRNPAISMRIALEVLTPRFCRRSNADAASSIVLALMEPKESYSPDSYHFQDGSAKPVSRLAQDEESADRLWKVTSDLLRLPSMLTL